MSILTSLKVPLEVWDRFAAAAAARGCTECALLDQLSRQVAYQTLMDRAADQMRLPRDSDPDAWASYVAESREWEQHSMST